MIYGIGTDVCDIRRMKDTVARWGDRFARRVLGPEELQVYLARSQRAPQRGPRYLATRFSAKEAFSKAIGLGIRSPMAWRDCQVLNLPSGQPVLKLSGPLLAWFEERHLQGHVTVTDETDYAVSFVLVEVRNSAP